MSDEPAPHASYPPISDYGFIGDCSCTALVSRSGSIDWCCMPRMDSPSSFARLLDWEKGGYCRVAPVEPFTVQRSYLEDTLVLETRFTTEKGILRLTDLFPVKEPDALTGHQQLLRLVDCLEGEVTVQVEVVPRFDYGTIKPWIRRYRDGMFMAIGGCDGQLVCGDMELEMVHRHNLAARLTLRKGERRRLTILHRLPEQLDDGAIEPPTAEELDRRLQRTVEWWRAWAEKGRKTAVAPELVRRSALVLKGLTNATTGAIAAAATTSLPEAPQGPRNWDYRYSWIRDSVFSVRSLAQIGYLEETDSFRRFIERSAAGSASELQILFGVGGERHLEEYELPDMEGYRGARPVRIGNAASRQLQLDMYGELLDFAWRWHQLGRSPDDDYWEFLVQLIGEVHRDWRKKDRGIWEIRGEPRHFVFSKVMCWSAVDKAIALAEDLGRQAPLEQWRGLREEIRRAVETHGYDNRRGVFVQDFGGSALDASLLRMPMTDFLPFDDPRMVRTVDAIREELMEDGLVRRYSAISDGLSGKEGVFLACSFWLTECLACQGRVKEAQEVFTRALATGNDLGLYSEEYDTEHEELLGNFPQGLTHLSLISAALMVESVADRKGGEHPGDPAPPSQ